MALIADVSQLQDIAFPVCRRINPIFGPVDVSLPHRIFLKIAGFFQIKTPASNDLGHIRFLPEVILAIFFKQFKDLRLCFQNVSFDFLRRKGLEIPNETTHIATSGDQVEMVYHEDEVIDP